jgi:hypothetical protein
VDHPTVAERFTKRLVHLQMGHIEYRSANIAIMRLEHSRHLQDKARIVQTDDKCKKLLVLGRHAFREAEKQDMSKKISR